MSDFIAIFLGIAIANFVVVCRLSYNIGILTEEIGELKQKVKK